MSVLPVKLVGLLVAFVVLVHVDAGGRTFNVQHHEHHHHATTPHPTGAPAGKKCVMKNLFCTSEGCTDVCEAAAAKAFAATSADPKLTEETLKSQCCPRPEGMPVRPCAKNIALTAMSMCGDECPLMEATALENFCENGVALTPDQIKEYCCKSASPISVVEGYKGPASFPTRSTSGVCSQRMLTRIIAMCGEPCVASGADAVFEACDKGRHLSSEELKQHCCPH